MAENVRAGPVLSPLLAKHTLRRCADVSFSVNFAKLPSSRIKARLRGFMASSSLEFNAQIRERHCKIVQFILVGES